MSSQRNIAIDHLRGIAILAMILIHTSYYFIAHDAVALFLWNWSQFAVPAFVFCAGYVFFMKDRLQHIPDVRQYLVKRSIRLLLPYYSFVPFFLFVLLLIGQKISPGYLQQSVLLTGGIDINWLVLLMIQLAIVFPLVQFLRRKSPVLFYMYLGFSLLFSVFLYFSHLTLPYKFDMWFSWSLAGIVSIVLLPQQRKKFFLPTLVGSLCVFLILYLYGIYTHHDLSFITNKYPPDLYILSYGIFCSLCIAWLSEKGVFQMVTVPLQYLSKHSYALYFIHYCLLIYFASFLQRIPMHWYVFFPGIVITTIIVHQIYLRSLRLLAKQMSTQ